jgi:aspartate carbamoyltransferase regulatory subunit
MFLEMICPNEGCNKKMARSVLQKHIKDECQFKKIPCKYCGEEQPLPRLEVMTITTTPQTPQTTTHTLLLTTESTNLIN